MERHDQELSYKKRRLDSTITGDIPNPKSEDGSKLVQSDSTASKFWDNEVYKLYIKGLVSDETVVDGKEKIVKAGFGVAIFGEKYNFSYEIKESLISGTEISRREVEIIALIRGLREACDLGISHVLIYCNDQRIYEYIIGRGKIKQNIVHLVDEIQNLLESMASSDVVLVARNDVNFAFRLAREAIASQSVDVKAVQGEICVICFEETDVEHMFFTDKCLHRHCFSCVKNHVKAKLDSGNMPTCLAYGCKSELTLESCSKVLTPELIEMWKQKMKEDLIPVEERIYCPYPKCSILMSKTKLSRSANEATDQSSVRTCIKCCGLFCIDCKVPSHFELSCADYKKLHPDPLVDDLKLQSLIKDNMWRRCAKCKHMIELSHGCNHMTCRCGYEFCYKCGIEWKNNQQFCPSGCDYESDSSEEDMIDADYTEDKRLSERFV